MATKTVEVTTCDRCGTGTAGMVHLSPGTKMGSETFHQAIDLCGACVLQVIGVPAAKPAKAKPEPDFYPDPEPYRGGGPSGRPFPVRGPLIRDPGDPSWSR